MADPICRWRNTSVKQAIEYNSLFPLNKSEKKAARSLVENRWRILGGDSFFTTPYQLAAQMGMYYEDDEFFYPKFPKLISIEEAYKYMLHWGKRYYAPNPYTKSLNQTNKPVILNNFLVNWCLEHPDSKLDDALAEMFIEPIGNTDILVNMLNSFSEVKVNQGKLTLKDDAPKSKYEQVVLDVDKNDKKFFFEFVSKGWADSAIKSPVVLFRDKVLKNFVFKVFQQLESFDGMNSLEPYAEESNGNIEDEAIIIKFKNENIALTGCLIDTTIENVNLRNAFTNTTRWFSEPLSYCNRNVYLSTQWNGAGNYQLTFEDLKYFINLCYGKHYGIEKDGDGFIMYAYSNIIPHAIRLPLQQIFYGAPGTGKSHKVKEVTDELPKSDVFRTTFHPDSDYSTFVGCYKPKMVKAPIRDGSGHEITSACEDEKKRIAYEYEPQAFLKAYVRAYETSEPVFLVIEEINRGNCAQIFGDMFQLLDRNEAGESDYAIKPETAIQEFLNEKLKDCDIEDETIKSGEEMRLPANLHIWATMNTSDQSLFPIDSAFKRRWDWQYMPICKGRDENGNELKWKIVADTREYDWWSFLDKINAHINTTTNSEDKKLGFFFCKPQDSSISSETFVGKVIFYLWNDVFKDFGFEGPIFKDVDGSELSFNIFYKTDDKGMAVVQKDKVELFLNNLGVDVVKDNLDSTEEREEDEDGNDISSPSTGRDYTKFSINGVGSYGKNNLAAECVKKYIELNPEKTADEVLREWMSLGNIVPHFIETKEQFDARTDNSKRSHEIPCGDTALYVAHNGYGNNGKVQVLIDAVNNKSWGITLSKA